MKTQAPLTQHDWCSVAAPLLRLAVYVNVT